MPSLSEIKKFSVSENFYRQVVRPLYKSGNIRNLNGLLDLLKKIHSSLWTKSGYPDGFSGAVAGNFQEILDGYKHAVVMGHKVHFGADSKGEGGDTVREIVEGKGRLVTETTQFKVSASHAGEIRHHICKAAWQLTGAGGEKPKDRSRKVIEIVIQDGSMVEPNIEDPKPLKDLDPNDWKKQIEEALKEGYYDQEPNKTKDELYNATNYVYITTAKHRYIFMLSQKEAVYMGGGAPYRAYGYVFNKGRIAKHWQWLTNTYWDSIKWNGYDYMKVQKHGIGSGEINTPNNLPYQP